MALHRPNAESLPETCADSLLAASGLIRSDARRLLEHATGRRREWLLAHGDEALGTGASAHFLSLCDRRSRGEPLAYLVGEREFRGLSLAVNPNVLIPRPETELLVDEAITRAPPGAQVIDLGTGSGAIAIALAVARPDLRVIATDASEPALTLARQNANRHQCDSPRLQFRLGHWWQAVEPHVRFAIVVANPPYIAAGDPHLGQGDLRFEPSQALASGPDGLEALREIAARAGERLIPGGWILLEHGWDQGLAVRTLLEEAGLLDITSLRDLAGHERVTLGRAPAPALREPDHPRRVVVV